MQTCPASQGRGSDAFSRCRGRRVQCANRRPPQERRSEAFARGDVSRRHVGRDWFGTAKGSLGIRPPVLAELVYPGKTFPVVEDGAHCVLCQQDLEHAAAHRLKQFEAFVASTTERELQRIRENFARLRKAFVDLRTTTEAVDETLNEIRIEHEAISMLLPQLWLRTKAAARLSLRRSLMIRILPPIAPSSCP